MRVRVMVAVGVGLFAIAGCSQGVSSGSTSLSTSEICAKALGTVALSEVGDDFQRKANEAKDTANVLRTLSTQTQDRSLSQALSAAAQEASSEVGQEWSGDKLKAWADREQARFDAIRKVC